MEIVNRDSYNNQILLAIVLNIDTDQDPQNLHRIQIYVPQLQYDYDSIYQDYINEDNKPQSPHFGKFPWATSLTSNIKIGSIVYCSYINNSEDEYIILGVDEYEPTNTSTTVEYSTSSIDTTNGDVINLAMAIIISNEVGVDITAWPSGIGDEYYTKITPSDNGTGWSIGLIQWHHTRAYDLLEYITTRDNAWEDCWSDKSFDLYTDLKSANSNAKTKYQKDFKPSPGTPLYDSIKAMLGTDMAKIAQRAYATIDISNSIYKLQQTYNIYNPLVVIYLADLMNQYGDGIVSTFSLSHCSALASMGNDYVAGLDKVIAYAKTNIGSYSTYKTRREKTEAYCKSLNISQLNNSNAYLTDLSNSSTATTYSEAVENCVVGTGQYSYPIKGSVSISATYGSGYGTHYKTKWHTGVDFACSAGTPVYAVTDGTVYSAGYDSDFGNNIILATSDGMYVVFAHMTNYVVGTGQAVVRGQNIGFVGSTGNSSGPHLHFEIRKAPGFSRAVNDVNPFPYIGLYEDRGYYYDKNVNFG